MFVFLLKILLALLFTSSAEKQAGRIEPVTSSVQHAEGPHWDPRDQVLYYVDTFAPSILRWQPYNNAITSQKLDGDSVGMIIPLKDSPKKFVVCRDRWVSLFSWDGVHNNTGTLQKLTSVDKDKPKNQFNDGKVDSSGRLWAGTLTRNEDLSVTPNGGSLFSIDGNGKIVPKEVVSPVSISNGLAWSKDNRKFFFIDSEIRKVLSYKFDLSTGAIASPEILFDLENHQNLRGIPDGMTIDTDDNLWVALFGGKSVIKINSRTGRLLQVVEMPATYVTSVTFGGPKLDILYVTTSKLKLTPEEQNNEPLAGCVFAVYDLGVRGYPGNEFRL